MKLFESCCLLQSPSWTSRNLPSMKPPKPPHIPNDDLLVDFIAELIVAGDKQEDSGTCGPGLAEVQGGTRMIDPKRIKLANQMPLNRTAKKFLPPDWRGSDMVELHVLSLMRWGLENGLLGWLEETARIRKGPTPEQVESMINRLAQTDPKVAMRFLVDPEGTGDEVLNAEELLAQETPEDAAMLLLESLYDSMAATAP